MRLLNAYQEIRQPRCEELTEGERDRAFFLVVEEGTFIRTKRDEDFRIGREKEAQLELGWGDIEEEYLRGRWEGFKSAFGYDAYDSADDWWVDWGVLRARMNAVADPESASFLGASSLEMVTRTKMVDNSSH